MRYSGALGGWSHDVAKDAAPGGSYPRLVKVKRPVRPDPFPPPERNVPLSTAARSAPAHRWPKGRKPRSAF